MTAEQQEIESFVQEDNAMPDLRIEPTLSQSREQRSIH